MESDFHSGLFFGCYLPGNAESLSIQAYFSSLISPGTRCGVPPLPYHPSLTAYLPGHSAPCDPLQRSVCWYARMCERSPGICAWCMCERSPGVGDSSDASLESPKYSRPLFTPSGEIFSLREMRRFFCNFAQPYLELTSVCVVWGRMRQRSHASFATWRQSCLVCRSSLGSTRRWRMRVQHCCSTSWRVQRGKRSSAPRRPSWKADEISVPKSSCVNETLPSIAKQRLHCHTKSRR